MTSHEATVATDPLIRPPRLQTGRAGGASRLELFFDLAYVLVVMQLASAFVKDLSWSGFAVFVGLFVAMWFSWVGFTLYANRFDTDDVVFRMAKLLATMFVAGCAASADKATGAYAVPFTMCLLAGHLLLLLLYLRAWRHVEAARPTIGVYLATTGTSAALWAVSLGVDGNARFAVWALAVAVDAAGPVLATLRGDKLPLHAEHLPERFALFTILVLGEAVGGAARGVHEASWAGAAVTVAVAGFLVAAACWWTYFDLTAASSERELEHGRDEESAGPAEPDRDDNRGAAVNASDGNISDHDGSDQDGSDHDGSDTDGGDTEHDGEAGIESDERHDLFVYGHLPLSLGIVLIGVGVEELVLHPDAALPSTGGWLLATGVVVYLAASALLVGGTRLRWQAVWPWPLAALPVAAAIATVPHSSGLLLVSAYAALLAAVALIGTRRSRAAGVPAGDD